jgi:potassium efflux system protein
MGTIAASMSAALGACSGRLSLDAARAYRIDTARRIIELMFAARTLLCVWAALIALVPLALAQDGRPPTVEEVAARVTALAQETGLDEAQRTELTQRWRAVQGLLEVAASNRAQASAWQAEEADAREVAAGRPTAKPLPTLPELPTTDASRATLEEALAATMALASEAKTRLAEINTTQGDRSRRKPELASKLADARTALAAARADAAAPPATDPALGAGVAEAVYAAQLSALQDAERRTRVIELEARVAMLETDFGGFDARGEALERRAKAWATLEQDATKRRVELEQAIQGAREREARAAEAAADSAARNAALEVAGRHVALQEIARVNGELSRRRTEFLETSRKLQTELASARAELASLVQRMAATKSRDALARGTQSIGTILRKEREALPDLRRLEQRLDRHARELTDLRLLEFDYAERQRALRLPGEALDTLVAETAGSESTEPGTEGPVPLGAEARQLGLDLLDVQGKLLAEALDELARTVELETELEATQARLFDAAQEYKAFIDERVLWVRSTEPLWRLDLRELGRTLAHHANPKSWTELPLALADALARSPSRAALYLLAVVALFAARRKLRQRDTASDPALRAVHIGPTFGALVRDGLTAAVWPIVIGAPAWMLLDEGTDNAFVRAVASGALKVLAPMSVLTFLRRISRTGGTGELHFGWGQANVKLTRRIVILLGPLYLLATFGAAVVHATGQQGGSDSLGRLFFLASMVVLLIGMRTLLRENGLAVPPRYRDEESWVTKLRPVWRLLGSGGALSLFGLSALGFDYTARQLHLPFERSLALMLAVLVVQAIAFRWLLLARRRILIEQARVKREAGEEAKALETEDLPDLRTLGLELRRAVRAAMAMLALIGIYWIWRNEIPALGALDRIRLYPFRTPEEGQFVFTASKLLVVLLAVFATGAVARRLPGLLDFLLLDRTGFTGAERYAVRSVTQYLVVALGIIIALGQLGVTWGELQWLAAAVSVGLGFGLQEIFANFVSGLILLFERPIRVGDLVTINGMEGRVTNIRIRATTILDYDRRELIVPNKAFVTGSLVNWTLSDPITRVVLPVNVAYGSDIGAVHRLLLQAAREVHVVLRDPAPNTVFRRFGDSALEFELRVFLGDRDHWPEAVNGVNGRIAALFEEHGIDIPFPQSEVHVITDAPPAAASSEHAPG